MQRSIFFRDLNLLRFLTITGWKLAGLYISMKDKNEFLEVKDLRVHFPVRGGVFRKAIGACKAVDGVGFSLQKGQTLGLVGESGCGKSTLAKAIVRLVSPTSGQILFKGMTNNEKGRQKDFCRAVQMVFQDPAESLNSRMTVGSIIQEPLDIHGIGSMQEKSLLVQKLLEQVGLPASSSKRYPLNFLEVSDKELELQEHSLYSQNFWFLMNRFPLWMFPYKVRY